MGTTTGSHKEKDAASDAERLGAEGSAARVTSVQNSRVRAREDDRYGRSSGASYVERKEGIKGSENESRRKGFIWGPREEGKTERTRRC